MRRAWRGLGPEAAVLALAAVLRLTALGRVPTNPYYDAAVRSMGTSWAAFLGGAFEPGRRVAIDKPPVDLWLQVASTRLFGFHAVSLLLPAALGGVALVAALMWLLHTIIGRAAALAGGLALAVAPSAVIVARSDTMDAVMAALAVAGAAVVARAARGGRVWSLAGAGVLLGLAFEVKLAEAVLPIAAAVLLWVLAGPRARRPRLVGLGLLGTTFVATALAWLVVVTVVPLHPRPWALGASDGSPWRAALVYNGIDRLLPGSGGPTAQADVALRTPPHATRTESGAGAPGSRARRRAGTAADRARAAAPALGPRPSGPVDRLRGRRGIGGARRRAGAAPLARARPRRPRRAADARALARRRRRAVQRDAGIAPALPGLPGSRGGSVPGRGNRPGRAWPSATRTGSRAPRCSARCSCSPSPRRWPRCATAPRRRGARGRCRRPASRRCRTSCARTRPARPTRSPSARRPRQGR